MGKCIHYLWLHEDGGAFCQECGDKWSLESALAMLQHKEPEATQLHKGNKSVEELSRGIRDAIDDVSARFNEPFSYNEIIGTLFVVALNLDRDRRENS